MIYINQSDLSVGILELMILAIGCQVHVCALLDRRLDELSSGSAT
jgi:hypothetical protein